MARMIGTVATSRGCCFGKHCTCNGMYRDKKMIRDTKRAERNAWKRDVVKELV